MAVLVKITLAQAPCNATPEKLCTDMCAPAAEIGCIIPSAVSLDVIGYDYQVRTDEVTDWQELKFVSGRMNVTIPIGTIFDRQLGRKYVRIRAKDAAGNVSPWFNATFRNIFILAMIKMSSLPPWPPPEAFAITNIEVFWGGLDQRSVAQAWLYALNIGVRAYSDRSYTVRTIPSLFENASYIQMPNGEKFNTTTPLVTFDVNRAVNVCIARDEQLTNIPEWLQTFTPSRDSVIETTDTRLAVSCQAFPSGQIALGSNEGTSGSSMYMVIVIEQE